MYIAVQK